MRAGRDPIHIYRADGIGAGLMGVGAFRRQAIDVVRCTPNPGLVDTFPRVQIGGLKHENVAHHRVFRHRLGLLGAHRLHQQQQSESARENDRGRAAERVRQDRRRLSGWDEAPLQLISRAKPDVSLQASHLGHEFAGQ